MPRVSTPSRLAPGWDGLATESNGTPCDIEALPPRSASAPSDDLFDWNNSNRGRCSPANTAAAVSPGWFASYDSGQPLHAAAPSITASDTSIAAGSSAAVLVSGATDFIVQFNPAAAGNPAAVG